MENIEEVEARNYWKKAKARQTEFPDLKMSNQAATNVTEGKKERGGDYGTPVAGSKTAQRGHQAHARISNEIVELCAVIEDNGQKIAGTGSDPVTVITFGRLFDIYTYISNKLVGVLLRARKYGLVAFEGETLFQRRDDDVVITLLVTTAKAKELARENKEDFQWGKCM